VNKKFYILTALSSAVFFAFIIYLQINAQNEIKEEENALILNAQTHFNNILNVRKWNANYGNIYSDNPQLTPNPYLKNNQIQDSRGHRLVNINPAWMTRQLSELFESTQMHFAIVSNDPINPKNQASGFFKEGLEQLKNESLESYRYQLVEKEKKFEFIGALRVTQACLKCHSNYQIGQLRGGIAITLDATHYFEGKKSLRRVVNGVTFVLLMLLGLFCVVIYQWFKKHDEVEKINVSLDRRIKQQTQKLSTLNQELQRYNSKLSNVIHGSNLGYWDWNLETGEYFVNERWLIILGLKRSDVNNQFEDFSKRLHPIDRSHIMPMVERSIAKDQNFNIEFRMLNKRGEYIWIEASGAVVERNKEEKALRISGTHQDISKRKALESIRNKNREYLNILFDNNPNIVVVTNSREILSTNNRFFQYFPEFSTIKEFKQHYACICDLFEYMDDENFLHPSKHPNWVEDAIANPDSKVLIKYHGNHYYFKVIANFVKFDGEALYITTFTDITQLQLLQRKLEEISIIDELTGLYNRRYFNQMMKTEFAKAKELETTLTFVMMDLDNFKQYNDNYGHDRGDEILASVARELKRSLKRSGDYMFRLGGEEFGLLFINLDYPYAIEYANSMRKNIANLQLEHNYNNGYGIVTLSLGLCFVDFQSDTIDLKEIYHYADQALYESKTNGRNVVSSWRLN